MRAMPTRTTSLRLLATATAAASLVAGAAALAAAPPGRSQSTDNVSQELLSRSSSGGAPNAPASEPVFSWDGRAARYVAFTSAATDIRPGTDGHRNIFLVKRGGGSSGGPWQIGSTTLASAGKSGAPANGDSFGPALGGFSRGNASHGPSCLAFVSEASNLASGDDNGRADVFVRNPSGGSLKRIPAPAGKAATEVGVAGNCKAIVYVAGGSLYVKRGSGKPRKVASGGVSDPRSTFNGAGLSFRKGNSIYAGAIGGHVRKIASGTNARPDAGDPSSPGLGKVRFVSYERGGTVYYRKVGGFNRSVSAGTGAQPTAGGGQVLFGADRFVYLYAVSNNFGKAAPQGFCPSGEGNVTATSPSGRANYVVFSCSGGKLYLSYLGGG
jgi:hypothetical protein